MSTPETVEMGPCWEGGGTEEYIAMLLVRLHKADGSWDEKRRTQLDEDREVKEVEKWNSVGDERT
jgi:hypothetical protein